MSLPAFDESKSKQIVKDAERVTFNERQERIFEMASEILLSSFPEFQPIVIRGLLRLSVRDWQKRNNTRVTDVDEWSPEQRFCIMQEIADIFQQRFSRILKVHSREAENVLEKIVADVLRKYRYHGE